MSALTDCLDQGFCPSLYKSMEPNGSFVVQLDADWRSDKSDMSTFALTVAESPPASMLWFPLLPVHMPMSHQHVCVD